MLGTDLTVKLLHGLVYGVGTIPPGTEEVQTGITEVLPQKETGVSLDGGLAASSLLLLLVLANSPGIISRRFRSSFSAYIPGVLRNSSTFSPSL